VAGQTRGWIRREVGHTLDIVLPCTATSVGTQTTLIDVINGYVENNSLNGYLGWVAGGTSANLYSTVRVTGNTKSSSTITFTPALTSNTATSDVIEFYDTANTGITPDEIHRAINRAIAAVNRNGLTEALATATTFSGDTPYITVGATVRRVLAVEWQDDDEDWHEVPPADVVQDRVNRTLRVDNHARWLADGNSVRLRTMTQAAALTLDTATTPIDEEYIVAEVCSQLLFAHDERFRDPAAARAKAQYMRTIADSRRPKSVAPTGNRGWAFPV
jgi:hypothetical protein